MEANLSSSRPSLRAQEAGKCFAMQVGRQKLPKASFKKFATYRNESNSTHHRPRAPEEPGAVHSVAVRKRVKENRMLAQISEGENIQGGIYNSISISISSSIY